MPTGEVAHAANPLPPGVLGRAAMRAGGGVAAAALAETSFKAAATGHLV